LTLIMLLRANAHNALHGEAICRAYEICRAL